MTYDPGVIIRAHRFRAEMAGFRLVRGHYMDGDTDNARRWYLVPLVCDPDDEREHRANGGYRTINEAASVAVCRAEKPDP